MLRFASRMAVGRSCGCWMEPVLAQESQVFPISQLYVPLVEDCILFRLTFLYDRFREPLVTPETPLLPNTDCEADRYFRMRVRVCSLCFVFCKHVKYLVCFFVLQRKPEAT